MNLMGIIGIVLGMGVIWGGSLLQGGGLFALLHPVSLVVVLGGTLGAVLVAFPFEDVLHAFSWVKKILTYEEQDFSGVTGEIVEVSQVARKEGLLALESQRQNLKDPLFKKSLGYLIDGVERETLKTLLHSELDLEAERFERVAQVFEAAGSYAPVFGVIGAVLSLLQLMTKINQPAELGGVLAGAFIAVLYGLVISHLLFLPWGTQVRRIGSRKLREKETVIAGVLSIQEGLSPLYLKERVELLSESLKGGGPA